MTKTIKPGRGLTVTGKTRESVLSFFKNMIDRRFTEAEKALSAIRERKFTDEEYKTGYINALDGLLLSVRSGDERDFYNRTNLNKKNLKEHKEEFKEFRKTPIRTQFDSGYFAAWSDIMQYKINVDKD
ncbi:hypothetical protein HN807_08420 [Candidatus Bathyarchaeota archaeon]|nr:hypothetical protein [Candidatus Bathyarchaeota archaeon]MBT4320290.1 hypothetical protein [Candidatus Bathyarchaeota archaeon]MBT5643182.1 hypothetical protein [Candidatus Bathyarchaeota archaeon]MBT6603765.1 hypothetical protein [Candidatus Bathyarchaeota archaeon]MBT7186706.1 hypothetical protein [Candidatus Bathyarchaeota archaeon]